MLQKLGQTCSLLRYSAKDKLPKEMEIRQFHLQALQHVLSSSNNVDSGLSNIQAKLVLVKKEAQGLKRMRHELQDVDNDEITVYGKGREVQRQQVQMTTIVANKIRDALDTLASLFKRRDLLISQLQQKLHSIEEVKGSVRRGEDLKQYVEALRGKSATYKALKKELDDLATENVMLVSAQHLLEHRLAAAAHGATAVVAFGDNDNKDNVLALHLDDDGNGVSKLLEVIQRTRLMMAQQQQHALVDEQSKLPESAILLGSCDVQDAQDVTQSKRVWQQISKLDTKLQEQRAQVGPLSMQLREARTTMQALESQHTQRETHFSKMSLAYERKFANLEFCVSKSRMEIEDYNKQLHKSTLHVEHLEVVLDQLSRETEDAVSEELQSRIELHEELLGSLHQKQQKLKV